MNCLQLQRLFRQNQKLKNKLKDQSNSEDCLNNDLQTQIQLVSRQRYEIEQLKKQIKLLKKKLEEEQLEREQVEHRYVLVLQKLEEQLEQYKKKYSKLQNKIAPLIDQDTVRLKILNQVQGNHHLQVSNLKQAINNLKDEVLKHRRLNEVLRHSLQNQKMNFQEQRRRIKTQKSHEFAQDTINYLTFSMWKDMQAKLKSSYDQAKKEADFYKQKYFAVEKKYQTRLLAPQGSYLQQEVME